MQSNEATLKTFTCPIHKDEPVQRVNPKPSSGQVVYCVECIMETEGAIKSNLVTIKNLVEQLPESLNAKKNVKIGSRPPESFTDLFKNKDKDIQKFADFMNLQKEQVCKNYKIIQDSLLEIIEKSKQKALYEIDA